MTSAQRVFERRRIWRLPHATFLHAARLIAEAEEPHRPQTVIGIARGGTRLAEVVAGHLGVHAVIMTARHNTSDASLLPATGRVHLDGDQPPLSRVERGSRLLLVDDIAASGATLRAVTGWLTDRLQPTVLRTAVLCRNQGTDLTPNTWGWDVADWVRFPWEDEPGHATEPLPALTVLHHRERPLPPSTH
ncbi:phosphoribosyltransferase [Streptomyces sp. NPDC000405]|uniref:phosphoribosyltransferase n=1 Tax=Streptomyces sp. NPDC000405 TaxID=3161033 RepID=UPI00398D343C